LYVPKKVKRFLDKKRKELKLTRSGYITRLLIIKMSQAKQTHVE